MSTAIVLPSRLRIGGGASNELADVLQSLGLSHPLVVTDPYMVTSGRVEALTGALKQAGIAAGIFSDTVPDPTVESIDAGVSATRLSHYDCVVGFGGGSSIDSAKAIAVLAVHGGRIRDYAVPHQQNRPGLPILAIPTTAGTGSEATRVTIITDGDEKLLCMGTAYQPVAALVDFELTLTMPRRLTADTGIDALTHAIEAYVSRKANPFSDSAAIAGMRAIAPNLRRVFRDPSDRAAREAMMVGSLQGGIAFSNSSVALVHGMSRPIGAHFHIAHGLSNAMLLPSVTAFSISGAPGRYADCARFMCLTEDTDIEGAGQRLLDELVKLNEDLEVPSPAAAGIDPARWIASLPVMAAQALASGSPGNNPKLASAEEIQTLYAQMMR